MPEYAAIWDSILPGDFDVIPPELADLIILKRVMALAERGDPLAAVALFGRRPEQRDTSLDVDYAKIEIQATGKVTGPAAELPAVALELAYDALRRGDNQAALDAFEAAGELSVGDAATAARLAAQLGAPAPARFLEGLPHDREAQLAPLARPRDEKPADLSGLTEAASREMIARAAAVLEAVDGLPPHD